MDAPQTTAARRRAATLFTAGAGAVLAAAAMRFVETAAGNIDDAFILLVYAKHFVTSGRLYYNLADGPIDGFTSPLDLWLKSAAIIAWPRDPIFVCWLITFLCHLAVALIGFYLAARIARIYGYPRALGLALAAGLALAGCQGLADGSAFLLETPLACLVGLALVGAVVIAPPPRAARGLVGLGLLLAALPLARPEGLPLAAILGALHLRRARGAWPRFLPLALAGAILGVYYIWRIRYFGYWAPNTYYAKTSDSRLNEIKDGFGYIAQYALSPGAPGLLVLVAAPSLALVRGWSSPRARADFLIICGLALISLAAVVYAGGDCYGGGRFLAFPLVLSILALTLAAAGLPGRRIARASLWTLAAVQGAVMIAVPIYLAAAAPADLRVHFRDNVPVRARSFACDREIAGKLAALVGRGVAAQTDYQRLKYFADELYVRDLTGLNDRRIAHTPVSDPVRWGKLDLLDAAARAPLAIVLGHHVYVHPTAMSAHPLREVFNRPELYNDYFGYTIAPVFIDALTARYQSASLPACGGYFNFLLRADQNPTNLGSPGQP